MEQGKEIEFLLVDTTGVNKRAIASDLAWLADCGGGCVVTPDKRTMKNAMDAKTDGTFKRVEEKLRGYDITLSWKRRGLPYGAKSVIALYMDKTIDEVIKRGSVERVLFVPWMESEADWFKSAYKAIVVDVDDAGNLVAAEMQPAYESVRDLIPDEQDRILEILARTAACYDSNLQGRERERFKADLMNCRSAWVKLDPKVVLRRCAELGMSAEDADEISGMVKQLREGHRFRPKRGYENGWRH